MKYSKKNTCFNIRKLDSFNSIGTRPLILIVGKIKLAFVLPDRVEILVVPSDEAGVDGAGGVDMSLYPIKR
jgi:hypothetical protein